MIQQHFYWKICLAGTLLALPAAAAEPVTAPPAAGVTAPDNRPVTQDQFKALVRVYKSTVERLDKVSAQLKAQQNGAASDGAVDLSKLDAAPAASPQPTTASAANGPSMPNFKVFFDLGLINRPGIENLSFDNYHSFLFFELLPTPDIQFSFDVNPTPRYYELDYQITHKLQLRAGKIWIPFDDMSPHNIFGGRVDVTKLQVPGAPAFLPDLWTDLGVGFKYSLFDKPKFQLDIYGYAVNGFRTGGSDLVTPGSPYPSFQDLPTGADNNRDKALGGRVHALVSGVLGLGASYYTEKWNNDADGAGNPLPSERLSIMGLDAQIRVKSTEFRVGVCSMSIDLPTGTPANRGGAYVELGQKFGAKKEWKALARAGLLQLDDRVLDTSTTKPTGDVQIVGGTLLWKPGLIEYSIESSQDLKVSPSKTGYSYTAARIIMAF